MALPSVRTVTHTYPQAEINAMTNFYGGKRCVITLNALLQPCNERLSQMLMRKLRKDRHPRHAAEVQENVVPPDNHIAVDERPPRATLFLHEDILARTLAYEQDLHQWRITELEAGRGDPGRPTYEEASVLQAFGGTQCTQHRFHAANSFSPFIRNEENGQVRALHVYEHQDCPGIDDPTSRNPFPVIDTLLSIPFSLLHNLPRLAAIVPISVYQQQLITMGSEIAHLWWWDPPPDLIEKSEKIRLQKNAQNQYDGTRNGSLLTPGHEGLAETGDVQRADKGIVTGAMSLPVTFEAWDVQTIEGTETSDDIDAMEDVEEKPPTGPSSSDILSWYEQVAESAPEPLPLIPGSFERGVIGGMSTNDVLMIKGLIDPPVYIQFLDLSLFSRL
ncbi:hypothetical protein JOM56_004906 [Amanita muscaria]